MAKQKPFSEQLREAVQRSELTRYAISKETGIAQSILARFVNDSAGLSLANVDKLCEVLGVGLSAAPKRKPKR
jgi:transcriptional regulator with XRE-family HTH domain